MDSPAALGLNLGNLDGGVGMGYSMSGMSMGFGSSIGGRGDDEDRRKRMEDILKTLRTRPGRVSEENLERICKTAGLESMWENLDYRTLFMAGTTLVLEIGFVDNAPTRVKLDVQSSTEADQKHFAIKAQEQSASNLLRNNLTPTSGQSRIALTLDKFAANLERLARLDKLEGASFNCFEALAGVYASLKRLYDHEMKAAMTLFKSEGKAAMEVMCKKSGKPRWNAGNTVGLGIDYWTGRRFSPRQTVKTEMKGDAMDVDSATQPGEGGPQETYFLSIECESHPAQLYQSARITNDWLSEQIEKVPPDDPTGVLTELLESLDWLEPPPTYLKPSEDDNNWHKG